MISFRLSAVEFTSAQADCERRGMRSVSGLARRALLGVIAQQPPDPDSDLLSELPVDIKVERLSIELAELRAQLDRLGQALLPSPDPASVPPATITPATMAAAVG